jgi:hypothetical protein
MSPTIEISNDTFKRLQSHATPLVDTIESVVAKMIDAFEKQSATAAVDFEDGSSARSFNISTPPDLTHAKILGVEFDGQKLGRNQDNWNGLLHHAVRAAKEKCTSEDEFYNIMVAKYTKGDKTDEGYRPVSGTGISVQGQDANGAWRAVCHIAQELGCSLIVKFAWREKEGAAFPGVIGQMTVSATKK